MFVNLLGISLIIFIYWFFFMKKESRAVEAKEEITIDVLGGYKPDVIKLQKGKQITLKFHRKDESSCLEDVVIPDFGIRQYLRLNEITEITFTPNKSGTFTMSCGMNMFHGKLIVEESK